MRDGRIKDLLLAADVTDWQAAGPLPALAADAIRVSSMPSRARRVRGFYPAAGLTATVHDIVLMARSPLLRGSRVARRCLSTDTFHIPKQFEARRSLRRAWVVEELIDGAVIDRPEWHSAALEVADGLEGLWAGSEPESRPLGMVVPWLADGRTGDLLDSMGADPATRDRLVERIGHRLTPDAEALVGWTHGDPARGNVLRTASGGLALVDWERAGRNLLGLDALRLVTDLDDPDPVLDRLETAMAPLRRHGMLGLRHQAALALLRLLPTWVGQASAWHDAGCGQRHRNRNTRRIRLLDRLLARDDPYL